MAEVMTMLLLHVSLEIGCMPRGRLQQVLEAMDVAINVATLTPETPKKAV